MADLITQADVVARMGTLNAGQSARVAALISDASAFILAECPGLVAVTGDVVVLQAQGGVVTLPGVPVASITSVEVWGITGWLALPAGSWLFNGGSRLTVDSGAGWIINLPEPEGDDEADTFRVTYSHGFTTTPAEAKTVAANMVMRALAAPTLAEGVTGENIGQYGWQANSSVGSPGAGVRWTEADRIALRRYRTRSGTMETPVR
jgi:hypothetical protein